MPSMTSNLLALTAILALATLPSTVTAAGAKPKKHNLRKKQRQLRRGEVHHLNNVNKKQQKADGLEEDVAFWTNMVRRTQDLSMPTTPTPPGGCSEGASCSAVGAECSDGTTEECCDDVFDSFICECGENDAGDLVYTECRFTDACLGAPATCPTPEPTPPPVVATPFPTPFPTNPPVSTPTPPTPTPPPASGFNCPSAEFVGCTAVDPENPVDECPTVGEPCPDSADGEFCCLDDCPRNYCTAKEGGPVTSSTEEVTPFFAAPIDMDEVKEGVSGTTPNSP